MRIGVKIEDGGSKTASALTAVEGRERRLMTAPVSQAANFSGKRRPGVARGLAERDTGPTCISCRKCDEGTAQNQPGSLCSQQDCHAQGPIKVSRIWRRRRAVIRKRAS